MKKTLTANISGTVFHIEEDAYEALQRYLGKVRSQFSGTDGRDEIMADIEARIAELFNERLDGTRQVVSLADVEHVIGVMGQPEDYADGTEQESTTGATGTTSTSSGRRRLYRDPDDKWVGGVLGGVGAYFDVDPLILRLIYLAFLFLGFGFILYLILWVILPSADSAAEKLQMRGEEVNVENIKRVFEEGAERVQKGARTVADEASEMGRKFGPQARKGAGSVVSFFGEALRLFLLAIGKVIGVAFLAAGTFLAIILMVVAFAKFGKIWGGDGFFAGHDIHKVGALIFDSPVQFTMAWLGLLGLLLAPMIGLILAGISLLFGVKSPKWIGWVLAPIWIAAIAVLTVIGIRTGLQFSREEAIKDTIELVQPVHGTITIRAQHDPHFGDDFRHSDEAERLKFDGDRVILGFTQTDVVQSPDSLFHLVIERIAHGPSMKAAAGLARNIQYNYEQHDSLLVLAPWYSFGNADRFRAQQVRFVLQVPVGSSVHLDNSVEYMLDDVHNVTDTWDRDMVGKTWTMTLEGLQQVGGSTRTERSDVVESDSKSNSHDRRKARRSRSTAVGTEVTTSRSIVLPDLARFLRPRS